MKLLSLGPHLSSLVSDEDVAFLSQWNWYVGAYGYVRRSWRVGRKCMTTMLHQVIAARAGLVVPEGHVIDHRDGNTLNNQRENLRVATYGQNRANSRAAGASKYLGVHAAKKRRPSGREAHKWVAQITVNAIRRHLGRFSDEAEAARAYDRAARELHGDFARLNFPDEQ